MASCTCNKRALLLALLHAAKYPHCVVNGVLLGTTDGQGGGEGASGARVDIVDAVPLFHVSQHVATPLEVALAQARTCQI
jgi:hypothetical protein